MRSLFLLVHLLKLFPSSTTDPLMSTTETEKNPAPEHGGLFGAKVHFLTLQWPRKSDNTILASDQVCVCAWVAQPVDLNLISSQAWPESSETYYKGEWEKIPKSIRVQIAAFYPKCCCIDKKKQHFVYFFFLQMPREYKSETASHPA